MNSIIYIKVGPVHYTGTLSSNLFQKKKLFFVKIAANPYY